MTRTSLLHRSRRRRGPARLVLLAAAGLGVARYVATRSSGSAAAPKPDPAPSASTSDSGTTTTGTTTTGTTTTGTATSGTTTTATDDHGSASATPSASQGVRSDRLALEDEWGTGPLDGAWWPDSSDAARAVPGLVEALPDALRVSRLALPMPDWSDDQPKTLQLEDRTIHLAWFAGMQRNTARITFENGDAVTVLVLPTDTEAEAASRVLSQVGESRSREDLLAEAGVEV